jgi:hypothetical protein
MNYFLIRNGDEIIDRETGDHLGLIFRPYAKGEPWSARVAEEALEAETLGLLRGKIQNVLLKARLRQYTSKPKHRYVNGLALGPGRLP